MIVRIIAAIAVLVAPSQAAACSLIPGTFIQSNFEMIDSSEAIVVARAVRTGGPSVDHDSGVIFKVETTLKGSPTNEVSDRRGWFGKPTPSDPKDILSANPEAFAGFCDRSIYRRGDKYVLMLKRDPKDGYIVYGDVFSRINEDDFGPDSLWRRAINIYLEIQKNPNRMAQIAALEMLAKRGSSPNADAFEEQLGEDALNHLRNIHPDKPTPWLIALYNNPDLMVRDQSEIVAGTGEESAQSFADLVVGARRRQEDIKTTVLRALSQGDHPDAEPLFRSILAEKEPEPTQFGAALAYFIRKGDYDFVQQSYGQHVLWIEAVSGPGAGPGFWTTAQEAVGYGEEKTVTPDFYSWWRKQTVASCIIQNGPYSCSTYEFDTEPYLSDPRAHQRILLADSYNKKLIAWAESEVRRLTAEGVKTFKDDWDFPVDLLLASYNGDKPKLVHEMACGTKNMRELLATEIGEAPTLYTRDLMREMMAMEQHPHVRQALFKSSIRVAAHEIEESQYGAVDLPYAYARSEGPLPLGKDDERHLNCPK